MASWKTFKDGDTEYLSIVYKSYGNNYGGYYVTSHLEPGDLYIPLPRNPKEGQEL